MRQARESQMAKWYQKLIERNKWTLLWDKKWNK